MNLLLFIIFNPRGGGIKQGFNHKIDPAVLGFWQGFEIEKSKASLLVH